MRTTVVPASSTATSAEDGHTSTGGRRLPAVPVLQLQKDNRAELSESEKIPPPLTVTTANTEVVQRKEPYDSQGKDAWEERINDIETFANHIGIFFLERADIAAYLRHREHITPPSELSLDNKGELGEYLHELENVRVEDAITYAKDLHEMREWRNYREEDPESSEEEDDLYYSSEEDEIPDSRVDFDRIVQVIGALENLLSDYVGDLGTNGKFLKIAQSVIANIIEYKKKHRNKTFPEQFNEVPVHGMKDWLSLAHEFRYAKGGGKNQHKPTVYNIKFKIWDNPEYGDIKFRGRQLKDARGNEGRSWPAIALDLHCLAEALGADLLKESSEQTQTETGTRVLAAAMLAILGGRGNEVYETLKEYGVSTAVVRNFESILLEFFALTMGIENIRMEFTQLDTILHLNNIARGATLGDTEKKYNFLNVFSSVRENEEGEMVHVFDRGRYVWVPKKSENDDLQEFSSRSIGEELEIRSEITEYKGHKTRPLEESLDRPRERGEIKSSKSIGKSMYSHSAGHGKTQKLLGGDGQTINNLWEQVREVKKGEDRRKLHSSRFQSMGPIRLYNLFANLVSRHEEEVEDMTSDQIAAHILDLYINFVDGTVPGNDNPFRDEIEVISGCGFDASVFKILNEEAEQEPDEEVRNILVNALEGEPNCLANIDRIGATQLRQAMVALVNEENSIIDLLRDALLTNHLGLIRTLFSSGVHVELEDKTGLTPLAMALELHQKGQVDQAVIELLLSIQDNQKRRKRPQMPKDWLPGAFDSEEEDQWLTDEEVRGGLLEAGLPNTHVAPAVNITNDFDVLAEFIRDNYLHQLGQGHIEEYTVIPINFNNAHWATLVIRQNPDRRSAPAVYFFDSLGEDDAKVLLVRLMLQMTGVYTQVGNIHDMSNYLQDDGYTCGTWMIGSATRIVSALQRGATMEQMANDLRDLGESVAQLHEERLKRVRPQREQRSEEALSLGVVDMEGISTGEPVYYRFGNGEQEYSEQWIKESYEEYVDMPTSLAELGEMLMVNYGDVDLKMKKIYRSYLTKILALLNTKKLSEFFEEEIEEIKIFLEKWS